MFNPRFLLPLMIFLGVLVMGVRLNDMWDSVAEGRLFRAVAPLKAASSTEVPPIDTPSLGPATGAPSATDEKGAFPSTATSPQEARSAPPKSAGDMSPSEMELVKQLAGRREELDKRSRELDMYEARLSVAEKRVDQKMKEMETLRAQLQAMVNQLNAAQQAQIENLVKIYETMKPKEAARIFETLELPVLLGVVQKMKPQRTAAVMAEMAPEKAKEITVALTRQDQLPPIK